MQSVLLIGIVLAAVSTASAGTATQPVPLPLSADGVAFPPVVYANAIRTPTAKHIRLVDVENLIMRLPTAVGVRLFDADKSSVLLNNRSKRIGPVPKSLDTDWFAIDIGNADVAGIDLEDGVVARIVLFYHDPKQADGMVRQSYGHDRVPWHASRMSSGVCLELDRRDDIPSADPMEDASRHGRIVLGMTEAQAEKAFGKRKARNSDHGGTGGGVAISVPANEALGMSGLPGPDQVVRTTSDDLGNGHRRVTLTRYLRYMNGSEYRIDEITVFLTDGKVTKILGQ